ncbi:MAG: PAS domain-containing protein [Alphaproteobacteria bacterium]|nr:PAS domain-containing protein [Alphaproteobacteria bacterium]
MLYGNPNLTGVERTFDANEIIVTKTDLTGKITYGNNTFYKMAGCTEKDALGVQHNLIRHPEMPRAVFKLLWDTLAAGQEIFAYVNNRSLNGDNYWVLAHVTPSFDVSGNIISYHSSRRKPDRRLIDEKIVPLYKDLLAIEKAAASPKEGMNEAVNTVVKLLEDSKMNFNQLMFSLGM